MIRFQLSIIHASLLCSTFMLAEAQDIKLSFSACAISLNEDTGGELYVPMAATSAGGGPEWLKVPLNELTVGETVDYRGPATLRFFAKPEAGAEPVASIRLEATATAMLLVFVPESSGEGYRIIAIADNAFPYGSYYFQNLSPHPVAIELGGKNLVIKPGESAVRQTKPGEDEEVRIHASIDGNARLIRSTAWRLDAGQRELVFFHTRPGSGIVSTKHVLSTKPAGDL